MRWFARNAFCMYMCMHVCVRVYIYIYIYYVYQCIHSHGRGSNAFGSNKTPLPRKRYFSTDEEMVNEQLSDMKEVCMYWLCMSDHVVLTRQKHAHIHAYTYIYTHTQPYEICLNFVHIKKFPSSTHIRHTLDILMLSPAKILCRLPPNLSRKAHKGFKWPSTKAFLGIYSHRCAHRQTSTETHKHTDTQAHRHAHRVERTKMAFGDPFVQFKHTHRFLKIYP